MQRLAVWRMVRSNSICLASLAIAVAAVASCSATVLADSPRGKVTEPSAPNAAGIYWQAFAALPKLGDDARLKLDEATGSTNAPLNDDLQPIVEQYGTALHQLRRAAKVTPCDWQLDYDAGPYLLLPHLQKARELSRVSLLQARLRFAAGDHAAAVGDVLDTLKMARDCGSSPILISYLVAIAIEKTACDVLAAHLPQLPAEQLDRVVGAIGKLPPTATIEACMQWEATYFGGWVDRTVQSEAAKLSDPSDGLKLLTTVARVAGLPDEFTVKDGDVEAERRIRILKTLTVDDVRASVKRLHADYETLVTIMTLDRRERAARLEKLATDLAELRKITKRDDALRYVSTMLLPTVARVGDREYEVFVRRQLLEQAIQVQRTGPASVRPIDGRPVEHLKTDTGFELRCQVGAKTEVLSVGK